MLQPGLGWGTFLQPVCAMQLAPVSFSSVPIILHIPHASTPRCSSAVIMEQGIAAALVHDGKLSCLQKHAKPVHCPVDRDAMQAKGSAHG